MNSQAPSRDAIRHLLKLYAAFGVQAFAGDAPVDLRSYGEVKFRAMPEPARQRQAIDRQRTLAPPPAHAQRPQPAPASRSASHAAENKDALRESAEALAGTCATLEQLREAMARFDGSPLKETAQNCVFADGVPGAPLMVVGEAPGRDEDQAGLPFVGRSGRLLDAMLAAIGHSRQSNTYITNILPWRPIGNRDPHLPEALLFVPFLRRHIALAQPQVILALGKTSARYLLDTADGIMRLRGKWHEITVEGRAIPVMPSLHPAYLLRQPQHKRLAWEDLCRLRRTLAARAE